CVAYSALTSAAQRKIAYEHRDNIFVADTDGTHQKKIATGALPEISPDGTRVAFNTDEDSKTRPGPECHIAIADLGTGKITILKEIPSDNCFGRSGRRMDRSSRSQSWERRHGNLAL
ncbi:MAG TPA: hypothetical protein VKH14_08400, partial [Candidatus Udaeobacter sp.]|nr:hypothetical protein [Candidatus Udaeobacter sp.]